MRKPSYITEIPLPRSDLAADFEVLSAEEEMLMRQNAEKLVVPMPMLPKEDFQTKLLEEICCRFCSSKNVVKRGIRKTKYKDKLNEIKNSN